MKTKQKQIILNNYPAMDLLEGYTELFSLSE